MGKFFLWLVVLVVLIVLGVLVIDMYLFSFIVIVKEFGVGINLVQLIFVFFFVGLVVGQMFYGLLLDCFGCKLFLFFGIVLYFVCFLLCIFVQSIEILIVLRLFQGLGGSVGMVILCVMVCDCMGVEGLVKVFLMLMLVFGLVFIFVFFIGGLMLVFVSWCGIFVVLMIFGLLCMFGVCKYLIEMVDVFCVELLYLGCILCQYWGLLCYCQFMFFVLCGGLVQVGMFVYIVGGLFVVIELYGIKLQYFGFVFVFNVIGLIVVLQVNVCLVVKCLVECVLGKVLWVLVGLLLVVVLVVLVGLESLLLLLFGFFGFLMVYGFMGFNVIVIVLKYQGCQVGIVVVLMGML